MLCQQKETILALGTYLKNSRSGTIYRPFQIHKKTSLKFLCQFFEELVVTTSFLFYELNFSY